MAVTEGDFKRKRHNTDRKASWDSRAGETTNQQLLPGIPDDITIAQILPKLPWAMLQKSAVVSRGWIQALQNGKVYQTRVSANSTQTMFIHCVRETAAFRFSLYSVDDNAVHPIPEIPGFTPSTSSPFFTYIAVNGRLYVFGDIRGPRRNLFTYEYDLARHRGWRKRATPQFVKRPDHCAVMNDKIFVFDYISVALYDPDADFWSPIINTPKEISSPIINYADGPHLEHLASPGLLYCPIDVVRIKNGIYSIVERYGWPGTCKVELSLWKSEIPVHDTELQEYSPSQPKGAMGPWKQLECRLPLSEDFLKCPLQL